MITRNYLKRIISARVLIVVVLVMCALIMTYAVTRFIPSGYQAHFYFSHYILSIFVIYYIFAFQQKKTSKSNQQYEADALIQLESDCFKEHTATDCIAFDGNRRCTVLYGNNLLEKEAANHLHKYTIEELPIPIQMKVTLDSITKSRRAGRVEEEVQWGDRLFRVTGIDKHVNASGAGVCWTIIINEMSLRTNLARGTDPENSIESEAILWNRDYGGKEMSILRMLKDFSEALMIQNISTDGWPSEITFHNKAFIKVLDVKKDSVSLTELKSILKPIHHKDSEDFFSYNFVNEGSGNFMMRLPAGSHHPYKIISLRCSVIKIGDNSQLVTFLADETVAFEEKETLLQRSNTLQNYLASVRSNVVVINKKYEVAFWSQNIVHDIGPKVRNMVGQEYQTLARKLTDFDWSPHITKALNGQVNVSFDFQIGQVHDKWYRISFAPFYILKEIGGVICIMHDVTESQRREQDLVNQKIINEEVEDVKKIILSNISHEIRTPLNNINGFLNLFRTDNLLPKQQKYLSLIKKSSDQLLETVTNIVTISLLEANQLKFHYTWFSLSDLLHEIKEWGSTLHYKKENVRLVINDKDPSIRESKIFGEYDRMKELLEIFIKNAIKFTPKGHVALDTQIVKKSMVNFTISDTGIGMESTYADLVFQPFLSAHIGTSKVYNGIGLGLSIAKNIVDNLKGTIDVETEVGVGTTFLVQLPISKAEDKRQEVDQVKSGVTIKYKKVLLIENAFESSEIFKIFFLQHDLKITPVNNGANAIETFFNQHDFDIVFCDLRLPDIDGFEVLKALQRMNTRIPVIAQSAFAFGDLQKKCMEAGFSDFIVKPIDLKKITKVLSKSY